MQSVNGPSFIESKVEKSPNSYILLQDLGTEDDELRIESSLPPEVKGQLRCFLAVTVDEIKWQVDDHPKDIQVCLQWWGETGDGTMFW